MRKILHALTILILIYTNGWSQCTPTWPTGGGHGISPDSATNLPHAIEGLPYSATIQFFILDDTTITNPITLHVVVDNFTLTRELFQFFLV